eukprot:jgi/Tetstr1/434358/TSEL_023462.t1
MDIDEYRKMQAANTGRKLPPGYRGHVPGVRTHTMGKTFGSAIDAADHMKSVIRSGVVPEFGKPSKPLVQERVVRTNPVAARIPGYTGFVPGSRNHVYGCTYAESCRKGAIAEQTLLRDDNPTKLVECVDQRPLVVTKPHHLIVAGSGKLRSSEMRAGTKEAQTLKKAREFVTGVPLKEELPPIALDTTGNIPGYGGYVAANQHIYSQTYGNTTRKLNAEEVTARPEHFKGFGADRPLVDEHLQGPPPAGYTGFIPARRNHVIAQTFSREMVSAGTAHTAILDRSEPASWTLPDSMPGLGDNRPTGCFHSTAGGTQRFDQTFSSTMDSSRLGGGKIPGYTGHLPGLQHTFGRTYGSMTSF